MGVLLPQRDIVYIAEKPDQAKRLANVIGANQRRDGYFEGSNGVVVTYCFGHLLETLMPDDYDPNLKTWSFDTLPIIPDTWRYKVSKDKKKQVDVISKLLKNTSSICIATDYDREGELIARSLLKYLNAADKPTYRLMLRALDDKSIRTALDNVLEGQHSYPLYKAALSRQSADWHIGMNFSRLYSMAIREAGANQVFSIGRVQTPTVKLVVDRDRAINNFTPSPFYVVSSTVHVANGNFLAQWVCPEDRADSNGRCITEALAADVIRSVTHSPGASIKFVESKLRKEFAPLPFDLAALQKYGSAKFGWTADKVLKVAQSLYDDTVLSYPRTDSRYLPVSQFDDAPEIFSVMIQSDPVFGARISAADLTTKGRMFNDAKITAHHAIIPTVVTPNLAAMTDDQRMLYDAVRTAYAACFFPAKEYMQTNVDIVCAGHLFKAKGRVTKKDGWTAIVAPLTQEELGEDTIEDDAESTTVIPAMTSGENARLSDPNVLNKTTRPPPHFTQGTLISGLENIARFVLDPALKATLKDTSGLGTPATRSSIIQEAISRGYLKESKKTIISTPMSRLLIDVVAPTLSDPGTTALWEQELEDIASGVLKDHTAFINQIKQQISNFVNFAKENRSKLVANIAAQPEFKALKQSLIDSGKEARESSCPVCGGLAKRLKRKKDRSFFWKCQEDACGVFADDVRGKPVYQPKPITPENAPKCPTCGSDMRLIKPKPSAKRKDPDPFYGCTKFKEGCKGSAQWRPF
jgi:DNA topoisomerase-3